MSNEFDHLPNTLDAIDETLQAPACETVVPANGYKSPTHLEPCKKCRGSGRFLGWSGRVLGPCYTCKGKGQMEFRTSSAERAQKRATSANKKLAAQIAATDAFIAAQPEVWAWIQSSKATFPFAAAMFDAIAKYGSLTENQLAACLRSVERRKQAAVGREERKAAAPVVDVSAIEKALSAAFAAGLKSPKLRAGDFKFSKASATSANPGAIYVKQGSEYLGKIVDGRVLLIASANDRREAIVEVCKDPKAAAIAYGRMTGSCSCCGRELTDPVSIEKGIGPICEAKFGW